MWVPTRIAISVSEQPSRRSPSRRASPSLASTTTGRERCRSRRSAPRLCRDAATAGSRTAQRPSLWSRPIGSLVTSPCSSPAMTCSRVSASRSFLHPHPTSSPRTRPPLFWCAKCWGPSLNLRRPASLRSWQQLGNASVSVRDGAREESPSVKQDLRLSLSPVDCAGVGPRVGNYRCVTCRRSWRLVAFSMSLASPMLRSLWRACCGSSELRRLTYHRHKHR